MTRLSRESVLFLAGSGGLIVVLAGLTACLLLWRSALGAESAGIQAALDQANQRQIVRREFDRAAPGQSPFLDETEFGLAAAKLQQRLGEVAVSTHLSVNSIEVLPAGRGLTNSVKISLNLSGTIAGLGAALHTIEAGLPILFVTQVDVDAGPAATNLLNARLIVEGFTPPKEGP